jgi:HPt (histidine-containing phosphotransfer) domain-containing protein
MDAYVAKPVEAEELFATIEQLASGKKREDAEERPREASADVLDRDTVFTRVGGDPELLLEMVSVFRDESAKLLHEIRRGVSRRDSTAVERAAHSLKGALAALAARAASEAALRLESIGRERDLSGVDEALSALEHEMGRLQKELCLLEEAPIVSGEAAS